MVFKSLVDSLSKLVGTPAEDRSVAMDIVDRHGRHHQPKAIPEGGQYEEEGQYLHGQAKVDAAIRSAGSGKHASLLREHVAPLYAKLGHDSATRAKLQAMHEDIRGLSKGALLKGMAKHLKDMKRHAEAHNEIKDMGKEEFKEWLDAHPEYKTEMTDRLLGQGRYNRHYDVKGGFHDDGTGKQKHEAWEEAKWSVGAKAMASMILFQEHADALHNAPDAIMANMIERATREEPQVENEPGATPQIPPTEQITANTEGEPSAPGISQEDIRGLAERMVDYDHRTGMWTDVPRDTLIQRTIDRFNDALSGSSTWARASAILGLHDWASVFENDPVVRAIKNSVQNRTEGEPRDAAEAFANHVDIQAGAGSQHEPTGSASNTQNNHDADITNIARSHTDIFANSTSDAENVIRDMMSGNGTYTNEQMAQAVRDLENAGLGESRVTQAIRETISGANTNAPTYTDRDGNVHAIEHNEGGLKAPIHQSEIGAVQAEMRQAFADAGNGVEGAEEYAHALSHFLGRGQDARSPHPGMRQEGLLKHQLAEKMQTRLQSKLEALEAATQGNDGQTEEAQSAARDYQATQRAVRTIAEKCGITSDMLPEGTNFNRVRMAMGAPIRAANPDHQEAVNALHALANPEHENEETARATAPFFDDYHPTDSMRQTFGAHLSAGESATGSRETPENIVNTLNGNGAEEFINQVRNGVNNPSSSVQGNGELANYLQAIRQMNPQNQLDAVRELMGVSHSSENTSPSTTSSQNATVGEPRAGNAQQNQNRTRISPTQTGYEGTNNMPSEEQITDAVTQLTARNGEADYRGVIQRAFNDPDGTGEPAVNYLDRMLGQNHPMVRELRRRQGENAQQTETAPAQTSQNNAEPQTATQSIGEHAHSLAERIHGELDRVQRSITGAGTSATVEAIESAITRALSNPDNEYARALMGETTDRGYSGIADAVNEIGNTPEMQAIRAEIQRHREAGNGQQTAQPVHAEQTMEANETTQPAPQTQSQTEITDDMIREASRIAASHPNARGSAEQVEQALRNVYRNGYGVEGRLVRQAEEFLGADHPITRDLRDRAAAFARTRVTTPTEHTDEGSQNAQQTSNAQAQNAENASRRPFSHAGTLPQNHPLRQFTFSAENMNRSNRDVGGMPYNFTRASQVTPQRLAKLTSDLPIRGIFDHRDGTVDVPGHGRVQGGEAIRMMLTDPSSAVGSMMRQRLATWQERNGNSNSVAARAVRRMNQAMDLLHPDLGSTSEHGDYRPTVMATLRNGDKRYSQPKEVMDKDTETARSKGFERRGDAVSYRGSDNGCNCYRNDAALLLQDRGFDVMPLEAPANNQKPFLDLKLAMGDAYERVNKGTREETIANLERMRTSYPNGTWISMWSGGHNTSARLKDGRWYFYSGWDGKTRGEEMTSLGLAWKITEPPKSVRDDDTSILYMSGYTGSGSYSRNIDSMAAAKNTITRHGYSDADFERFKSGHATPDEINRARETAPIVAELMSGAKNFRAYKVMTKRALMAKGNMHPTDEQVRDEMNREPLYWKANSTYVIKPTDALIPELFDQVRRA